MIYRWLADAVVALHFGFVLFVVFGGLLALRWRRAIWFHIPAAVWGVLIEYAGWTCPLTPLEHWLRARGGAATSGAFIDRYILPLLYPVGLARPTQWVLGSIALAINIAVYGLIFWKRRRAGAGGGAHRS